MEGNRDITWNISTPKWKKSPIKAGAKNKMVRDLNKKKKGEETKFLGDLPSSPFSCIKFWKSINHALCKIGLCLNSDFDSFKWTKKHICKSLSR